MADRSWSFLTSSPSFAPMAAHPSPNPPSQRARLTTAACTDGYCVNRRNDEQVEPFGHACRSCLKKREAFVRRRETGRLTAVIGRERQQRSSSSSTCANRRLNPNAPGATIPLLLLPMPAAKLPPKTALAIMPPLSTRDVRAWKELGGSGVVEGRMGIDGETK